MRRKHEVISGHNISVWDDGPSTCERYTVVDLDTECDCNPGNIMYLGMNETPFSPNMGVALTGEMPLHSVAYRGRGGAFNRRISFYDLPGDCQICALHWLTGC